MSHLVITRDLVQRLDGVLRASAIPAKRNVAALPDNPLGVAIAEIGGATCHLAAALGDGWWNRVVGLATDDPVTLDAVLAFFADYGVTPNIDLSPVAYSPALGRRLAARGLALDEVSTILAGPPTPPHGVDPDGIEIREVGVDQAGLLADLWADGFGVQGPQRDLARLTRYGSFQVSANRRYVAYVEGAPVAMAALYLQDGVGFLNVAAPLPPYRRRGIHAALTRRRVLDAIDAGCDLLMGHTASFATTSQNNMERRGLQIAYNQLTFTRPPAP